jgi:drug/metabolite transporter (DMT)-like permease
MPVVLSLIAALSYGLADFVGGVASKRFNPWSVALIAELGGACAVGSFALAAGGEPTGRDFGWGLVAGLANGFGTAFLYRGLSSGRMGVVAPVSGVGAATLPVLVGLASGERPAILVWVGIIAALPGIWLVSRTIESTHATSGPSGLLDGILAGVGFGGAFVGLAQIGHQAGYFPLAFNQVVAGGAIIVVAVSLGADWVPRHRGALVGVLPGVLAGIATGLFMVASRSSYLTITSVITSLYPAFTVVLAATLLREHIARSQLVGLGLCLVSVSLVATG